MKLAKTILVTIVLLAAILFSLRMFLGLPDKILAAKSDLVLAEKELIIKQSISLKNRLLQMAYKKEKLDEFYKLFFSQDNLYEIIDYLEQEFAPKTVELQIQSIKHNLPEVYATLTVKGELKDILSLIYNADRQDKLFFIESFDVTFNPDKNTWEALVRLKTYALEKDNEK